MDVQDLRSRIIQKIDQIEDESLLNYLQNFLDASDVYFNKKVKELKKGGNKKTDTIDYTGYIKEWVKEM